MNYIHATLEQLMDRGHNFGGKKSAPPPAPAPAPAPVVEPEPEPVVDEDPQAEGRKTLAADRSGVRSQQKAVSSLLDDEVLESVTTL